MNKYFRSIFTFKKKKLIWIGGVSFVIIIGIVALYFFSAFSKNVLEYENSSFIENNMNNLFQGTVGNTDACIMIYRKDKEAGQSLTVLLIKKMVLFSYLAKILPLLLMES